MKNTHTKLSLFFVIISVMAHAPLSRAQNERHAVEIKATQHAVAPPLAHMAPIPPRAMAVIRSEEDEEARFLRGLRPSQPGPDAVLQSAAAPMLAAGLASLSTSRGVNWLGLGNGFSGYSQQAAVPDTNGAVGPTQYVQYINESFVVFNKSTGAVEYGPTSGNVLFQALGGQCAAHDNLDPVVQYDKLANRWVIMMPMFYAPFQLCVAVSTTSDAVNTSWSLYTFRTPGVYPDYPKLVVWPDGYYVTYNQGLSSGYGGPAACVMNRVAMLAGNPATMQCFLKTGTNYGAMLPADFDGTNPPPTGSPEYFLTFDYNDQSLDVWQFAVNWGNPSASTFTGPSNIPVAAFTEPCGETITQITYTTGTCVPQAGTTEELDSYGDRLMYRVAYRNFGSYASIVANHTVNTGNGSQTGIRWYELRNSGSGFAVYQQGTYAPDTNYRWMGSIAMDQAGDIGLGYSVSSSSMTPSIRYTGRLASDPLGQMEGETDLLSSIPHGYQSASDWHWGDYSSMVIDSTDDCTFWYTTEYQPTNGTHWATRIASFSFPACTQTVPSNYTLTVSEVGQGTVTSTDGTINCTNGSGTCTATYVAGTSITLNATPGTSWNFAGWSGPCTSGNPCNLTMTSNLNPTATFTSTWAMVNTVSNQGNPLTSLTIPSTGSGNLIAVALMFNGTTSASSVTDNAGNTYFSAGAHSARGNASTEIWYAPNSIAGATAITPHFVGAPTHVEITEWEVLGLSTAAPDAKAVANGLLSSTNSPGPAVTTTQVGDFIVSVMFATGTNVNSITTGNEFTNDFTTDGNGWAHITSNNAAAGTHQASWYIPSPVGGYCSSTVAFLPAN